MRRRLDAAAAERGILARDRGVLARAVTLVESTREADRLVAEELLERLLPHTGRARRVGISGPPGVGKSTLLEALGMHLVDAGETIAVLAVDPSSRSTGGSILGDKTRMPRLAMSERAFVRPSPSGDRLGGVAHRTREVLLLCEAFGADAVLVETVGVGQSEIEVANMVDCFVLLGLGGAGDDLQGIKRGIMEVADIVAVNKADGDRLPLARAAMRDYSAALRIMRPRFRSWTPRAMLVSGLTGAGVDTLWESIDAHRAAIAESGELATLRRAQAGEWLRSEIGARLDSAFRAHVEVSRLYSDYEARVEAGQLAPSAAARRLVEAFLARPRISD
ncbi:MAG: methylmalonyl Co-A mutase-associated GTPase MeaB [Polyangiaceae bacterium]